MDSILTSDDSVIQAGFDSKLDSLCDADNLFFNNCTSSESQSKKEDEKKKTCLSLEMDRTCIRPMNSDDIISKELPFKILDTDFDGKDEDNVSTTNHFELLNSPNSCYKDLNNSEIDKDKQTELPKQSSSSEEQFKSDITEQDTGYSSDAYENVKSANDDNSETAGEFENSVSVEPNESTQLDVSEKCELSAHSCTNIDENTTNSREVDSTSNITAFPNEKKCNDDFVPTIVNIRGACDSEVSNETTGESQLPDGSMQQISIVNVQSNAEKLKSMDEKVHVIDDDDDRSNLTSSYNPELDIKQEPQEVVDGDECMYVSTENADTRFTSEIFIEEETASNKELKDEEEEIICLETSGQIPLPIPIKSETNINACKEQSNNSKTKSPSNEIVDTITTRETSRPVQVSVFTTPGYTCHLCSTTFQEHELLNDHMTLHRNNNDKAINKIKNKSKPVCPTCKRQMSTWQSLQQHVMIHNNEKPYICRTCKKDFRHSSNYKLHLQKHENEKKQVQKALASARAADFGKLVGPLFVKENLINQKTKETEPRKMTPSKLTFGTSFRRDNTKENVNVLHRSYACKTRSGVVSEDDDVVPLKTFNNVENIVMNAARFIVKVDNIDPNVLKKRIKTPDISIDKNSLHSRRVGEKRKIVFSPSDNNKRLKLDQIENIIMDTDANQVHDHLTRDNDQDYDYDHGDDYTDLNDDLTMPRTGKDTETLTDNELFELLNDDGEHEDKNESHHDYISELRKNAQMILKSEAEKSKNTQAPSGSSNVIMLKSIAQPAATYDTDARLCEIPHECSLGNSYSENSDEETNHDSFDEAFHRVAVRRILLIQKRAAKNEGKIDSRYLLGPLFWRKALRRAKLNPIEFDASVFSDSLPSLNVTNVNKCAKLDDRRTNDPAKLQFRAENKLSCMLDKIRLTNSIDDLNLVGPLFWKRTLQLAGIHYPRDLSMLLSKERLSLENVEFVDDDSSPLTRQSENTKSAEESDRTGVLDFLHSLQPSENASQETKNHGAVLNSINENKLVDSILSDVVLQPTSSTASQMNQEHCGNEAEVFNNSVKPNSILYDSLTKPLDESEKLLEKSHLLESSKVESEVVTAKNEVSIKDSSSLMVDGVKPKNVEKLEEAVEAEGANASIVLNVGENFQLVTSNNERLAGLPDGSNYVLVSDESGAMQLVKENDLRLVEGNDVSGAQYLVNIQGENYTNLELIGQPNSEQLTYALQFDGENYTTIQFVQNSEEEIEKPTDGGEGGEVGNGRTGFIFPDETSDLNSIGKELSDFLNLDYGTLMKNNSDASRR